MATLLAAAQVLQQLRHRLTGKIKFIFQPAEEGGKGSLAMIHASVLEEPAVEAIFGYHNWPGLPTGVIATREGAILAGSGRFEILLQGAAGHMAEQNNLLSEGARMVLDLDRLEHHLNLLSIQGGDLERGIATRLELMGVYFIESDEELQSLKSAVHRVCPDGAEISFRNFHPPTVNSPEETERLILAATSLLGSDQVQRLPRCQPVAEDFSEYLQRVPGCFFLVGAGEEAPQVHTAHYDFNDEVLAPAAATFCQVALNYSAETA